MKQSKQKGLTLIGFLMLAILLASAAIIGMKLVPVYLEFYSVKNALEKIAEDPKMRKATPREIKSALGNYFDVSYVSTISSKQVKLVREKTGLKMKVDYEVRRSVVGNLDMVAKFTHEESIAQN